MNGNDTHTTLRALAASPDELVRVRRAELVALLAERDEAIGQRAELVAERDTLARLVLRKGNEGGALCGLD